jgi:capsular polysaccharide transport system permease protein
MSLLKGLLVQCDVIKALILRETRTRFGSSYLGYLWAFIEPLVWITTFYGIFFFLNRTTPYDTNIVSFITTGLIPFLLFRQITISSINAIEANKALLFYPQVKPLDIIIARALLETSTISVVFIIIMLFNSININNYLIDNPLNVILTLILTSFLSFSLGLIFAAIGIYTDTIKRIVPPIIRILFFVSGIFYTPNMLPENIKTIIFLNPLVHLVEMLRNGWFIGYKNNDYSILYVLLISLYCCALGLFILHFTKRKLELT